MPELPEVETFMRTATAILVNQVITKAWAMDDAIVFSEQAGPDVARSLKGRKVLGYGRKGKFGWLELDRPPFPVFHFGMTGSFQSLEDFHTPPFARLVLSTYEGNVAFINKRRLGRVFISDDPANHPRLAKLGPDAFTSLPGPEQMVESIQARKTPIKALLLNQDFISGIGNWIADEVLFQAGIAPGRACSSLTPAEIIHLRKCLQRILRHAVNVGADDQKFPRTWLFHRRWGKVDNATSHTGHRLRFDTVGGRTTAWVPEVQA